MIRVKRLTKSFFYAFKGLYKVFKEEQNVRIQTLAAIIAAAAGTYFNISRNEWCFLILAITIVLLMEILNSAVERVADILKPRIDRYVKEIKDITAAAVMLASIMSLILGSVIFLPYIWRLLINLV